MEQVEEMVASFPPHQKKVLDEFVHNFVRHSTELKRTIDELRDELESCDNQNQLVKKKYDTAIQEVKLLRKCKIDQDDREMQLFTHTRKLVDMIEKQKADLKQRNTQVQILQSESEQLVKKIEENHRETEIKNIQKQTSLHLEQNEKDI